MLDNELSDPIRGLLLTRLIRPMLAALWRFRFFIFATIVSDLRARYARSRFGMMWHILHPMAQATIFAIVLSEVLGVKLGENEDKAAYPLYLLAGMAAWTLFSEILRQCLTLFIDFKGPLKKIAFPRLCLPIIVLGNAFMTHLLLLLAITVVFLFYGHYPNVTWLSLPLGAFFIATFAMGLGLILGIMNVFWRDIGQVMTVVLQLWFWVTPIIYPASVVPEKLRIFLSINPMTELVSLYQNALVFNKWPDLSLLVFPALLSASVCVFAFIVFRRASSEVVDAL